MVMINGIGTRAAMWAPLMAELKGFTLCAVDLPGYGLTDTTPQLTDQYRSTAGCFLEQVLDGLRLDRAMFIANSLGSLWTTWLTIDQPERVLAMMHVGCPALLHGTSAPLPMRVLSVPALARAMMKIQPPSPRQVEQLTKMVRQHPVVPELAALLLATERLPGFEPHSSHPPQTDSFPWATTRDDVHCRPARAGDPTGPIHLRRGRPYGTAKTWANAPPRSSTMPSCTSCAAGTTMAHRPTHHRSSGLIVPQQNLDTHP